MQAYRAIMMLLWFSLLTGIVYPACITLAAYTFFPSRASGSMMVQDKRVVGSELIGQAFDDPAYFWGRLSATPEVPFHAGASAGSNWGPTNPALIAAVQKRINALQSADPGNTALVPIDLATSSASGLDPHISPAAAYYQVGRIARARRIDPARVRALVDAHIEPGSWGFPSNPKIHVLRLNLALDATTRNESSR